MRGEDTAEGFMAVNGVLDGDRHAWEVWHGFDFGAGGGPYETVGEARHYRRYANDRGKFISEFGIHASPVLSTLEKWVPDEELTVHSASFDAHNKDHPKNKGDALLEIITGIPSSMEEYVDYTMVSQAEGLKFGVEHYRRREPHCSGTLVWQFNDVWPGFSWSVVDYETVPKAGYYALKRAFSPVLASFSHEGGMLALWVSNSSGAAVTTTAVVSLASFAGGVSLREEVTATLEPGESRAVWTSTVTGDADTYAWVSSADGAFPANRFFFGEIRELPLPGRSVRSTVEKTGETSARVNVEADVFSYLVRVTSPWASARFSDNYFDLQAGEARVVEVTGLPEGFAVEELIVGSYVGA